MIATRLIGVVLVKDGWVVQSIKFNQFLPIGKPEIAIDYLDRWGIDEIVLLDISRDRKGKNRSYESLRKYVRNSRTPVAIGGGISSVIDAQQCIRYGADKVVINTAFFENPRLIRDLSSVLGCQAVVVSIDAKLTNSGQYQVVYNSASVVSNLPVTEAVQLAEENGAGEIFINSVEADGSKTGYDLRLARQVLKSVTIPVVICGGVGQPTHFQEPIDLGVSGIAAGNYFHFNEHSVIKVKRLLQSCFGSSKIRLDTQANYINTRFDKSGNILPREEDYLDSLKHEYLPEEVI